MDISTCLYVVNLICYISIFIFFSDTQPKFKGIFR